MPSFVHLNGTTIRLIAASTGIAVNCSEKPATDAAAPQQTRCFGRLLFAAAGVSHAKRQCDLQIGWPHSPAEGSQQHSVQVSAQGEQRAASLKVDRGMHEDVIWLGSSAARASMRNADSVAWAQRLCEVPLPRCFFKRARDADRTQASQVEQRIWFHNPVSIVEVPIQEWESLRMIVTTELSTPVYWNGQDTNNIFHVLASFLSRLWLHMYDYFPASITPFATTGDSATPWPAAIYIFDLHSGRPHMFNNDGSPMVPGEWATEFARHAFPGVQISHAETVSRGAPVLFRSLHFNLVNWASWVLPSEDLHPPRLSRRKVGPHPLLVRMPRAVKDGLAITEDEGQSAVLLIRRTAPAGRRITNEDEFVEQLEQREVQVQVADLSIMMFTAQVEAVALSSVLVGAHGQGLFNLIFLPQHGSVVEVAPCGLPLSLVFNVAELFGYGYHEILDTSCDDDFMSNFTSQQCVPCQIREMVSSASKSSDVDSEKIGDCERIAPACDVRAAQTLTLNNLGRAADTVENAFKLAASKIKDALKARTAKTPL